MEHQEHLKALADRGITPEGNAEIATRLIGVTFAPMIGPFSGQSSVIASLGSQLPKPVEPAEPYLQEHAILPDTSNYASKLPELK